MYMAQLISSFDLLACPLDQLLPRLWNTKTFLLEETCM